MDRLVIYAFILVGTFKSGQNLLISWGSRYYNSNDFPTEKALVKVRAIVAHSWNVILSTIIFLLQVSRFSSSAYFTLE